jgi:hypothetical protein
MPQVVIDLEVAERELVVDALALLAILLVVAKVIRRLILQRSGRIAEDVPQVRPRIAVRLQVLIDDARRDLEGLGRREQQRQPATAAIARIHVLVDVPSGPRASMKPGRRL